MKSIPWIDHSPATSFLTMENIEWFSEPEEEEEVPIVVSVNIAPGKMDDLVLRPGENLDEIVKLFVAKHRLNPV